MNVSEAVRARHSVRAFLPTPVAAATVREILELAGRAPSGGNLQPWRVHALAGAALDELRHTVAARFAAGERETPRYAVYPERLWEPYRSRRFDAGVQRYGALGAHNKDPAAHAELSARNHAFFGAPVGLLFFLDRRLGSPQWADLGMYLQTVMLLATERGLDTCPQESWSNWPDTVAQFLCVPDELMLFAGMALGYRDPEHPLNAYRTPRAPFADFAELHGFADG